MNPSREQDPGEDPGEDLGEDLGDLVTERPHPASERLDALPAEEIVRLMNAEDAVVVRAVGEETPRIATAIDAIAERLGRGGRLIYCGAGTSGRLGVLDAVECIPTFQARPGQVVGLVAGGTRALTWPVEGAEDDFSRGRTDIEAIEPAAQDVVVGITASGRTPWVLGAVARARELGAWTIALCCHRPSRLAELAHHAITPVVGPEVLAGSTRLKAGTATKMVLNMLSTGAFVRLGKVYRNLMVDVQATNAKLRDRARRIVVAATGCDAARARELLERCGYEVKVAVVAARLGVDADRARALLARHGGSVRRALGEA